VKYLPQGQQTLFNMLDLPVPLDQAVPYVPDSPSPVTTKRARLEGKESEDTKMQEDTSSGGDSAAEKESEQFIPFEACLQSYLAPESVDMFSPAVGAVSACSKTQRFATFPRYCVCYVVLFRILAELGHPVSLIWSEYFFIFKLFYICVLIFALQIPDGEDESLLCEQQLGAAEDHRPHRRARALGPPNLPRCWPTERREADGTD